MRETIHGPVISAVGFRAHMGWANSVVLTLDGRQAQLRSRDEVDLRPATAPAHPYHAAAEVPPDEREAVLSRSLEETEEAALEALSDLLAEGIGAVGVVISPGVRHIPMEKILASNRLLHMAEATVYQQALRTAAATLRLPCSTVTFAQAEDHELWAAVTALGKTIGPPWRKDHKFAAVAAWVAGSRAASGRSGAESGGADYPPVG